MKSIPFEILAYLISHGVMVITAVAAVPVAAQLLTSRRTSQSMLAWLLALVLVPFVTIPLYLLLGGRKFPKRAKRPPRSLPVVVTEGELGSPFATVLRRTSVAPPRRGHSFELLTTGEDAYSRLLSFVRGAARSIDLTMFILGKDATGEAFVTALAQRAAHGVSVRLILDAVGSSRSSGHATRVLRAAGADVRVFMPLRHSPVRGRTNLRSHRKLAVFDRMHVFTGGMNLANEYMGVALAAGAPPRWRDVAAIASGPIAADAEALFESDWAFCGGRPRDPNADASRPAPGFTDIAGPADATLQVVPSGPDMAADTVYDLLLNGIFQAKKSLAIVTPYYVPDDALQHALLLAARRGVRTEVVVPARSNHRVADMARRQMLRELRAGGALVHYYGGGMVHAKAMVVDDAFAYVGSPNFDMRSLFLNYENALCAYSHDAIGQIRAFVDGLIAQCAPAAAPDRRPLALEPVARFLAPEL